MEPFTAPMPPPKSLVSDATAQRLLSVVERSPEITMNRKGNITHSGNMLDTSSKFTIPASWAT